MEAEPTADKFVPAARLAQGPIRSRASMARGSGTQALAPLPGGMARYKGIFVSISGGKDGQVALHKVCEEASRLGILDRVYALHADLGADEWPGTGHYVRAQADRAGVPLLVCSRIGQRKKGNAGKLYSDGEIYGDLHDYVVRRFRTGITRAWYRQDARWCTSEFKRGPLNALSGRLNTALGGEGPVLSVRGMRAEESTARRRMPSFGKDERWSSSRRHMDVWLPVHNWTEAEIWGCIVTHDLPYHWAYDLGMPRLSCAICMLNGRNGITRAGYYNLARLKEKHAVEQQTGEAFKADLFLGDVLADIEAGRWPAEVGAWKG